MREEILKDFYGRPIGILVHEDNGDQIAKDFSSRRIVGYYKAQRDVTIDSVFRPVSKGNTVVSLLFKK
jgi:hypothetical protein